MVSEGTVKSTYNIALAASSLLKFYKFVFHDWSTITTNNTPTLKIGKECNHCKTVFYFEKSELL